MKLLFVTLAVTLPLIFAASISQTNKLDFERDEIWKAWKVKYGKEYEDSVEEKIRYKIWLGKLEEVKTHSVQYDLGLTSYQISLNEFADQREDELAGKLLGARVSLKPSNDENVAVVEDLPSSVDWRTQGYVTGVKNQGSCGSCWAFSTTGGLEGQHFNASGTLVSLSEEQLVECCYSNYGCSGGWVEYALSYLATAGSISEANYPYTSSNGQSGSCKSSGKPIAATVSSYVSLPYGNEDKLKEATALVGPISVLIDVENSFYGYSGGVYYYSGCNPRYLNHAVLVVGYGTYNGQDYWLVKNSWGASWGLQGYIMMARNQNNNCGIASQAVYPVV